MSSGTTMRRKPSMSGAPCPSSMRFRSASVGPMCLSANMPLIPFAG